ncbi:MAG TPA: deoxynucleoside kinase [Solirubrobacterales bacterium]|nr:deoxynucleoside kinase [Solirubrobacterales bacterium]
MTFQGNPQPFIAVAGNIGAGKSGLVQRLAATLELDALPELTEANPYFGRFYAQPSTWAFRSQVAFALDSLRRHLQSLNSGPVVQDRTVYETIEVFSRILHQEGHLSALEMGLLSSFSEIAGSLPRQPTLLVYLDAPTSVLLERISIRARPGESDLTGEYLDRLREAYDRFVSIWDRSPVIKVDTARTDLRSDAGLAQLLSLLNLS